MKTTDKHLLKIANNYNMTYNQVKRIYDDSKSIKEFKSRIEYYDKIRSYEVK
jgi:hypothetical protein